MPNSSSPGTQWAVWAVGIGPVLFAMVAGWLLWRGSPLGWPLALWAYFFQLPHFEANGFQYWFYTTAQANAWLNTSGDIGLGLEWGTTFRVFLGGEVETTVIGVNLVAALAIYALLRTDPAQPPRSPTVSNEHTSGPAAG